MAPVLHIQNLTVAYEASRSAVSDFSLEVSEGEIVSLLGPSGCGKTTTMRAVAGLVAPLAGRILLDGRDVTGLAPNHRGIGVVFQSYALFPHLSVFDNVAFGLRMRRVPAPKADEAVLRALAMVGLSDLAHRLPRELSGGQQQRVALARAVAFGPRLMLLDEPLSNLDARLRLDMRDELARIQRESRVTMLYVTHDQSEALALSNRIVVMAEGRIEQVGTPKEIYEAPATAFVARFMGFETIADVVAGQLRMLDGAVIGRAPMGARDGSRLAWRPRGVAVGGGPYRGFMRSIAFKGDAVEMSIAGAGFVVKAELPPDCALPDLGAELAFDLPLARARLLSSSGKAS